MTMKSIWGEKFSVSDFTLPLNVSESPIEQTSVEAENKEKKKKIYMNHAPYRRKPKIEKDPNHLKQYLKKLGAKNAVDAMNKLKQNKGNEEST